MREGVMKKIVAILGALSLVGVAAPAAQASTVLDFSGNICDGSSNLCGNGNRILDTYGDVAGVIDVVYNNELDSDKRLKWWNADYNDLQGVAWGNFADNAGSAEIFLNPLNGQSIRLLGFDLGAYPDSQKTSQFTIRNGAGTILQSSGSITVGQPGNLHSSYSFNIESADGIRIQWGPSSYNVGIDNIAFEQFTPNAGAIPEPATWAMMIIGFGAAGSMIRRRKVAVA